MRLAIIDKAPVQAGGEIGPVFVGNLTKPEIGEKVRLSFVDGTQGEGVVIETSGTRFDNWSYRIKVETLIDYISLCFDCRQRRATFEGRCNACNEMEAAVEEAEQLHYERWLNGEK